MVSHIMKCMCINRSFEYISKTNLSIEDMRTFVEFHCVVFQRPMSTSYTDDIFLFNLYDNETSRLVVSSSLWLVFFAYHPLFKKEIEF